MAEKNTDQKSLNNLISTIPYLTHFPSNRFWVDYDTDADVLYVNLERPQNATDSEMMKNGIILRYRDKKMVGITVLDASKKRRRNAAK